MKQLQFYKYAIGTLLLLNLSMIAFFFITRPPAPHGGERPSPAKAIDLLGLDKGQYELFLASVDAHEGRIAAIREEQQQLLRPYFQSIIENNDSTDYQLVLAKAQNLEGRKMQSLHQHFQEVKTLLRPDQQGNFADFIDNITEKVLLKNNERPHPRKRRGE